MKLLPPLGVLVLLTTGLPEQLDAASPQALDRSYAANQALASAIIIAIRCELQEAITRTQKARIYPLIARWAAETRIRLNVQEEVQSIEASRTETVAFIERVADIVRKPRCTRDVRLGLSLVRSNLKLEEFLIDLGAVLAASGTTTQAGPPAPVDVVSHEIAFEVRPSANGHRLVVGTATAMDTASDRRAVHDVIITLGPVERVRP